jgi:L-alanine-DL-glutamate epimerase-like enolase superfamily enzyme
MPFRIEALRARPLDVPLIDPFVIATGRVDATRGVLIEAELRDPSSGRWARGLGESAPLPPITHEDQPDVLLALSEATRALVGKELAAGGPVEAIRRLLDDPPLAFGARPVARAGLEAALLDAAARLHGLPLFRLLEGSNAPLDRTLLTDVTIPIGEPAEMAMHGERWRSRGFRCFKVKVGLDLDRDVEALARIRTQVPDAAFRIDANGGYAASQAIALFEQATARGAAIECFEQPCAREDLDGMCAVAAALPIPVIADESLRSEADLERIVDRRAAGGINLKTAKLGGPIAAVALGRRAQAFGLELMVGGMVETRLGMSTAAHIAVALGGVRFVDLDTAWLLATDPFRGGYRADGPRYELPDEPGLAIEPVA